MNQPQDAKDKSCLQLGTVVANRQLSHGHHRLTLSLPARLDPLPGQFVQISCTQSCQLPREQPDMNKALDRCGDQDGDHLAQLPMVCGPELAGREALLNRPFSIAAARGRSAGVTELEIVYKVRGPGTAYLARATGGEQLRIIGPLGKTGFLVPQSVKTAILVGGGIGTPPLMFLAEQLAGQGIGGWAVLGAGNLASLPLTISADTKQGDQLRCEEFDRSGFKLLVATEDGSLGRAGLVTELLTELLDSGGVDRDKSMIFACGPWAMLASTSEVAEKFHLPCQVCLEQIMGCGMGTCQSCAVQVKSPETPQGWRYALVCEQGPVFPAEQVIWEQSPTCSYVDPSEIET